MALIIGVPQTFASLGDGNDAWVNTANIVDQDNVNSTCATTTKNDTAQTLRCTNFNFPQFPRFSRVVGIVAAVWRSQSNNINTTDNIIRLTLNGAALGQNRATATRWPTTNTPIVYGVGETDLWGTTIGDTLISNGTIPPTFGIDIKPNVPGGQAGGTECRIDHVRIGLYVVINNMLVRVNSAWQPVIDPRTRVGNVDTNIPQAYVRLNNAWQTVHLD